MLDLKLLKVTAQKEKQFNRKGIYCIEDLVRFFPRKYMDCTKITGILPETQTSCLIVIIESVNSYYGKIPVINASGTVVGSGETIKITWFNMAYYQSYVAGTKGKDVFVSGKVTYDPSYREYQIKMPSVFHHDVTGARKVYPIYSKIAGMSDDYLSEKMRAALETPGAFKETLPEEILREYNLTSLDKVIPKLHFPTTTEEVEGCQNRILFDELLYFAMKQEWMSRDSAIGSPFTVKTFKLMNDIRANLPYTLTKDQDQTIAEIISHVRRGLRTNALVQGDVGSGKTIIAFLLMAAFSGSGYQTVLMAPTKVLARQHYADLKTLVASYGYEVAYLGEELKASEKKAEIKKIETGEAKFIVGTHSVFG